jgi:diguanylate cyclase (GGDEF)-like protein
MNAQMPGRTPDIPEGCNMNYSNMEKAISMDQSQLKKNQPQRFYVLRIVGCIFAFLPICVTFYHLNAAAIYWFYAAFCCLMWPHIAYYTSIHSSDSNRTDLRHCLIESFLGGILVSLMSFNLLPSITLFGMFSVNNIGFSGLRFFLKGFTCFLSGILIAIPLTGVQVAIDTSVILVLSCFPALIIYPLIAAYLAYDLARSLNKTRKTLKQQNEKLEAANIKIKEQRDLLDNLSKLDSLTGIPNRRQFDEYLEKQWQNALRSDSVLSLIMIDIDHFKGYNDNYGHGKGDECLKQVAKSLSDTIKRPNDMLARYGGDEFVCVLPLTDLEGAKNIAEEMRKNILSLAVPHFHSTVADYVTISLGTATVKPARRISTTTLLKAADQALYKAKNNSRNCSEYLKYA